MSETDRTEARIKAARYWSLRMGLKGQAWKMLVIAGILAVIANFGHDQFSELPHHPYRNLFIILNMLALSLLAFPSIWFLLSPSKTTYTAFLTGILASLVMGITLYVTPILYGARPHWKDLIYFSLAAIYFGYVYYCVIIKNGGEIAHFWNSPAPPQSDLDEVESRAREIAGTPTELADHIIAVRIQKMRAKMHLGDEVWLVWGNVGRIMIARKEDVCYVVSRSARRFGKPIIALYVKNWQEDEDFWEVRLTPEALNRLAAWKPPEKDAILKYTVNGWKIRRLTLTAAPRTE